MDAKIKLAVRIVIVALLLLVALLGAKSVSNIIAGKIITITPYGGMPPQAVEQKEQIHNNDDVDIIVYNRNLFHQKAGAEEPEPEPEETTTPEEEALIEEIAGDSSRPVLTDLRILLKGTQVASESAYSIAMIMPLEGGNDARMLYKMEGDEILEEARILKIVRNRIYFERITQNNRLEYIDVVTTEEDLNEAKANLEKLAEKAAEKEKAAAAAAAAAEAKKNAAAPSSSGELVKKVGTDTYQVSLETVETIRKNPKELQRNTAKYGPMPKVQPVYKGGNIGGFRLLGVESNSVYAQLGLKSGDTIIDVNGKTIDGPQQAMALLDAFNGEDVVLKINRSGQEKTLTFQLK